MGNTNQLGFGSLASVAWTDMTGTDLTPDQLQAVNSDIDNASRIAAALIFKIKSAVADGLTSFSLDDLEPAYFQITDVRTDTANKGDDRPVDWADYISGVTGNTLSSSQALSISEWRPNCRTTPPCRPRSVIPRAQGEASRRSTETGTSTVSS